MATKASIFTAFIEPNPSLNLKVNKLCAEKKFQWDISLGIILKVNYWSKFKILLTLTSSEFLSHKGFNTFSVIRNDSEKLKKAI